MTRKPTAGGVGSNQYQTRPGGLSDAVRAEQDVINAAKAFGMNVPDEVTLTVNVPSPDELAATYGERFRRAELWETNHMSHHQEDDSDETTMLLVAPDVEDLKRVVVDVYFRWAAETGFVPQNPGYMRYCDIWYKVPAERLWEAGVVVVNLSRPPTKVCDFTDIEVVHDPSRE